MQMDIREIEATIPHRYPFLLIDHVEHVDGERIVARKMVSRNEPHFDGHFPGHPVMPGVLIVEAMAQAGAILAARAVSFDPAKQVIYFMGIDGVRFRKPVVPGDALRIEVVPLRKGGAVWKMKGEAKVGDVLVCSAEFMASIQPRAAVSPATPGATG